ncbi:MAG: hypothetical protein KF898_01190 [Parachlamydiales bacterium]|nr:hypothetical protein [Candidatus Acheromyda pituitae]
MSVQLNPQSPIHQAPQTEQAQSVQRIQANAEVIPQDSITPAVEAPSCCNSLFSFFQGLIDSIVAFFQKIFSSSSSTPASAAPEQTEGLIRHQTIQCAPALTTDITASFHNNNKLFAYQQLLQGAAPNALHTQFTKYGLGSVNTVAQSRLYPGTGAPTVQEIAGTFAYNASTETTRYWTANFADRNLFGFGFGGLLAQDELQILEHPGLYHLKMHLRNQRMDHLGDHEVALIENVHRLGQLDTQSQLATGGTLYGNNFAAAAQDQIDAKLARLNPSHASNIYAMAAPRIPGNLHNQPYQKPHLEQLFYISYTAFSAAKERSGNARCVVDIGKWGCGAFGNQHKTVAIIQLAAAIRAGVDEVRYYTLGDHDVFVEAQEVVNDITNFHTDYTVDDFLTYLADNAATLGLRYGLGNGT